MEKEKVLIMEPYKALGDLIYYSISDQGMKAILCHSWKDAFESLSAGRISLVIVDPAGYPQEPLQALSKLSRKIPIVVFTGLQESELLRLSFKPARVIPKTSNLEPLIEAVHVFLTHGSDRKKAYRKDKKVNAYP